MKRFLLCMMLFASAVFADKRTCLKATAGAPLEKGSIGIKLAQSDGGLKMMIMDAAGHQEELTFGNFISYSVDAILPEGIQECSVSNPQPVFMGYEWAKKKTLKLYINTVDQKKSIFSLPNLLAALSDTIVKCKAWDKTALPQPLNTAAIMFERTNGKIETMIMNPKGKKMKLNLGNLLSTSSIAFTDCSPGQERDRVVQIVIDMSDRDKFKVYQIDAYGKKDDFTFENMATAAAGMLGNCAKDASMTFAKMQPNSIKITFEKSPTGELNVNLLTPQGEKVEFDLGTLLAAAAQVVPFYEGKSDKLVITYARDPNGSISGTLTDLNGDEMDLTLQNLLKSATTFYSF